MALRTFYPLTKKARPTAKPQAAFSLLEMIAATALVASTLVPALSLIRDAMAQSREMNRRDLLAIYAVQKLEEQAALSMQYWSNATDSGNFAPFGHPEIGFNVSRSDAVADGGLVDRLMRIQVIVFDDVNGDLLPGANELQVQFRTKVAKLVTYENEPN